MHIYIYICIYIYIYIYMVYMYVERERERERESLRPYMNILQSVSSSEHTAYVQTLFVSISFDSCDGAPPLAGSYGQSPN